LNTTAVRFTHGMLMTSLEAKSCITDSLLIKITTIDLKLDVYPHKNICYLKIKMFTLKLLTIKCSHKLIIIWNVDCGCSEVYLAPFRENRKYLNQDI